ncbi:MAG: FAD-dependent oxidoreductase [Bacteroidota bacterium]
MSHRFDIAIVGGGSAGLTAATTAKRLGASVVLIERNKTGGECLHTGCIPSKTLIHTSRLYHEMKQAAKYGLPLVDQPLDFARVMDHVQTVIASIYQHENPPALHEMGIEVMEGNASFTSPTSLSVDGITIRTGKTIICTGSSPLIFPIEGLDSVPYLTNETVWSLRTLPRSMLIVGGGPISVEMGQAFARFGTRVTIVELMPRILPNEDEEISETLKQVLSEEGLRCLTSARVAKVRRENGEISVLVEKDGSTEVIPVASLLVSIGRSPSVAGLRLEEAGVDYSNRGIVVNKYLQTSTPSVYACGDVVGPYRFTHSAGYQADIAVRNATTGNTRESDLSVLPWVTFTDPEVARVGLTESEARKKFERVTVLRVPAGSIDRPRTEGHDKGILKIILDERDSILGVHAFTTHSGEYIHEAALAMQNGLTVEALGKLIHAYPTHAEILKKAATRYLRSKEKAIPLAELPS